MAVLTESASAPADAAETTGVFARLLGARTVFETHRTLIGAARACTGAAWAALIDPSGRVLMADLPDGVEVAPVRPAAWRRAAGEHLLLVAAADDGMQLALGRAGRPFDDDARRRVTALAATALLAAADRDHRLMEA